MRNNKRVVGVLTDLMFTVKIQDAAKRVGFDPVFVKSKEKMLEYAQLEPALIILDLNNSEPDPLDLIATLKANQDTRGIPLLGFVSHVQADRIQAAREKGCDIVLARSAFSQKLPAILQRYE